MISISAATGSVLFVCHGCSCKQISIFTVPKRWWGLLEGDVRLREGRLSRRLEVTPLLAATAEDDSFQMPRFDGVIPPPFSR
jgi:hypothetical protein